MRNYIGDLYPGSGRLTTFLATLPGTYDQAELSTNETESPPAGASNLTQANIFLVLIAVVGIMFLVHAI